ncbi:hypothetical protein CE91St42_19330 [Oscillospiraceae bacterium]|nr:hypothetical protein CE91St42_19330 [Oscillospiraceae bacterium]
MGIAPDIGFSPADRHTQRLLSAYTGSSRPASFRGKEAFLLKIVVVRSPKCLCGILRALFGLK